MVDGPLSSSGAGRKPRSTRPPAGRPPRPNRPGGTTAPGAAPPGPAGSNRPGRRRVPAGRAEPVHDVLVIGGGPGGASCAYWLAEAGWDVVLVEKKRFPREKTCGDGLTPRSVRQLEDMGIDLTGAHRYRGLRAVGFGRELEMPWPSHPSFPSFGYTITRHDLDGLVADRAAKAGATVLQASEAVEPLVAPAPGPMGSGSGSLPACDGAVVLDREAGTTGRVRARYLVVADGANSRFGRSLGTSRDRAKPLGMALRGYFTSPRHDDPFIESHLDIRNEAGEIVPGYGWIFPLGDGRVNVGVGLLSTDRRWKGANTSHLMDAFVRWAPRSWGISAATSCGPPTGGKLPMGLSVGPRSGPNLVVVGDAGGAVNPFNGEGIAYAYETGRMAAASVGEALSGEGPEALARYEQRLEEAYRSYYAVARGFVRLISDPRTMRTCVSLGMHSELFMSQLLRIMANLMRPDTTGAAEVGYRALQVAGQLLHGRVPAAPD